MSITSNIKLSKLLTLIFTVFVQVAPATKKRTYDKKNCCLYCTKEFGKLARHLEQVHHSEEEVKLTLSFPKSDKRRKEQFTKIRKMANFNHNMVVLETNKGELKVDRRPMETIDPTQYLPCKEEHLLLASKNVTGCSDELRQNVIAKVDPTIVTLGSALLEKRGREQSTEVSQSMRLLARVVIEARKLSGENQATLVSLINSKNFDMLLTCAKNLGGLSKIKMDQKHTKAHLHPSNVGMR